MIHIEAMDNTLEERNETADYPFANRVRNYAHSCVYQCLLTRQSALYLRRRRKSGSLHGHLRCITLWHSRAIRHVPDYSQQGDQGKVTW